MRRPFQRLLAGPFGAIALTLSVAMFPCATAADDNPLAKPNPLAKEDPLASADPFAGRFRSEDMEVVIENVGGRYSGEIRFRGESYRFEARRTDPKLAGRFTAGESSFDFEAAIQDGKLRLESGGATYLLSKVGGEAGEKGDSGDGDGKAPRKSRLFEKGKVYKHHLGFTFRHPDDWTLEEDRTLGLIRMTPPGSKVGPSGPEELYLISGVPAPGIEKVDDPRAIRFLDESVTSHLPFLRRTGEPKPIASGKGPGLLLVYEGTDPAGRRVRARLRGCLIEGFGVTFAAVGLEQTIESRDRDVQEMFETFGYAEAEKDEKLVGAWSSESFQTVKSVESSLALTTKSTIVLRKDGTFARADRTLGIADTRSGDYAIDTGGKKAAMDGRWSTTRGELYLVWNDGSFSQYRYHVQGRAGSRELLLTWGRDKKELWTEVR